jgi:hypothetical protein
MESANYMYLDLPQRPLDLVLCLLLIRFPRITRDNSWLFDMLDSRRENIVKLVERDGVNFTKT